MIIAVILAAWLLLDAPFWPSINIPFSNASPFLDGATDTDGTLNFAAVVMTELTQEEAYNGKLESIKGTGTTIPTAQIALAFGTSGTIANVLVQVGQAVQIGDELARLDTPDLARAVTQAEVNLRQAQIALERGQQPPTEAQIQTAQDAVDQAAAALRLQLWHKLRNYCTKFCAARLSALAASEKPSCHLVAIARMRATSTPITVARI